MTAERLQDVVAEMRQRAANCSIDSANRDTYAPTKVASTIIAWADRIESAAALSPNKRADGLPAEIGESLDKLADTIAWHLDADAGKRAAQEVREDLATADDDRR